MSAPKFEDVKTLLGHGPSANARANQRARLSTAVPKRRRRWLAGLVLVATVAAIAVTVIALPRTTALEPPMQQLRGVDEAGAPLVSGLHVARASTWHFADKSEVQISASTTVSLTALSNELVDLELQAGRVDLQVTHGTGRLWRIVSGRYETRVVGTRLHVERHGEQVDVGVTEGVVEVRGPDHAFVRVAAGETWSSPALVIEKPMAPALTPEPLALEVQKPERVKTNSSWRVAFARGEYEEAVVAARRDGVLAHAELLGSADVMSLATATRLTHQPAEAARLLRVAMSKPGEHRAEAAFLLGRIELQAGRPHQAAEAFETSVALAPDGPFGEEAGARLLETLGLLGQTEKLHTAAQQYLERFPRGAAAERANKVLHP